MDTYVYSDDEYDYCIVNGESLTRYYGPTGGQYQSCPIRALRNPLKVLHQTPWMSTLLFIDAVTTKRYKHTKKLLDKWGTNASNKPNTTHNSSNQQ